MDSVRWKEFRVGDLFNVDKGDVDLQQKDVNGKGHYLINSGVDNFGIKGRTDRPAKVFPANTITIDFWGNAYYRDFEYKMATHNHVFSLSGDIIKNREVGLFLVGSMASFPKMFSYSNMATWNKLKKMTISLPAKEDGTPDWDYMAERIKELEAERIKELEAERIKELEAYLIASGLDDYELTEEDKQVLAKQVELKEFKADELFRVISAHRVLSKLQLSNDGLYPAYSSDTKNNGIIGYCKEPEFIINETHPCYVVFGDHTRTMNIVKESFSVLDNVKVLVPPINNDKVLLFLITVWKKCIPNKGYARHWTDAKKCLLNLPVGNDSQPDWNYMERYIHATEKLVIADAVKWKDQQIATTKQIVDKTIA